MSEIINVIHPSAGPVNKKEILRYAGVRGAADKKTEELLDECISLVDRFGADPKTMTEAGIIYATDQIIDLYANGIKNVHVYSMNKPEVAGKISENLSSIIGKKD